MAYTSDESGEPNVWVLPFPPRKEDDPIRVSVQGGANPHWSRKENRLFYIDFDYMLMAVDWSEDAEGFHREEVPRPVLQTRIVGITAGRNFYCVKKDGEFLVLNTVERPRPTTIQLMQSWPAALQTSL